MNWSFCTMDHHWVKLPEPLDRKSVHVCERCNQVILSETDCPPDESGETLLLDCDLAVIERILTRK